MSFWSTQRVLITGGTGFLGSHLVPFLKEQGAQTFCIGKGDTDLTEQINVRYLFHHMGKSYFNMVIHLAANVGGIGANQANPARFFYDTLMMGTMVMEEARLAGVEKFVNVGTVCSYPKFTPIPFKESELWNGYPEETNAAYGLAKKMALVQSAAYRQQYGFNSINLLLANLYGDGDNFNPQTSHVIPAIIQKISEAKRYNRDYITLYGTGNATREFLHVSDAVRGIVLAAEHYNSSDPVNIGRGLSISIRYLAETIAELMCWRGDMRWDTSRPDGQPKRELDTSHAYFEFGFRAEKPLREGLQDLIHWYENEFVDSLHEVSHNEK